MGIFTFDSKLGNLNSKLVGGVHTYEFTKDFLNSREGVQGSVKNQRVFFYK